MENQTKEKPTMEKLLEKYKRFNYLNLKGKRPVVKILVSYIKPSFLFKSEILTPIQLGASIAKAKSKDGVISDSDLTWLKTNCEADNNGKDNISCLNRRIGFLTGTYWAYRNYKKLGNPKYFGSFGYRRLLSADCLKDIENYDFIIPKMRSLKRTVKEGLELFGKNLYFNMLNALEKTSKDDLEDIKAYFQRTLAYYDEIYIFKKEEFFNFCDWIFPILFELLKAEEKDFSFNQNDNSVFKKLKTLRNEKRDIAYIIERLTGYYIFKLTKDKSKKFKKVETKLFLNKPNETDLLENKKLILRILRDGVKKEN